MAAVLLGANFLLAEDLIGSCVLIRGGLRVDSTLVIGGRFLVWREAFVAKGLLMVFFRGVAMFIGCYFFKSEVVAEHLNAYLPEAAFQFEFIHRITCSAEVFAAVLKTLWSA